jgi:hypothetical protein
MSMPLPRATGKNLLDRTTGRICRLQCIAEGVKHDELCGVSCSSLEPTGDLGQAQAPIPRNSQVSFVFASMGMK